MMAIQEKDYKDLKEYWDYQRKIQYNKECVHRMAEKFEGRAYNDFGPIHIDDVKTMLWDKIKSTEYEDPPKHWIPKDPKLRFEWEPDPDSPKQLTGPIGRPVVLRAKRRVDEQPGILNDDIY
tara:strand:+ start:3460 stop:3825 length:366 start_codon:yes stop_codon:yes gene_type:complete